MRVLVLTTLLITGSIFALGQERPRMIFWTGEAACGYRTGTFTDKDQISCTSTRTERGPVSTISLNGVSLSAAFLERDEHIIVGARIANSTGEPVMFDTDLWGAAHFKTKSGYYEGDPPILAETSIPTRDMIRSVIFGKRLGGVGDKTVAETRVKGETREIRRSDGTRYKVDVIVPDRDEQNASARRVSAEMQQVIEEQARIRETALTAKSVRGSDAVQGLVYFRRMKEADFVVFSLRVGDTTFVFQLPVNLKS